ncbi:MAG: PAS domain-containing protein, partial [Bacteriovoracaceae bacterium]
MSRYYGVICALSSLLAVVIGGTALIGWIFNFPFLASFHDRYIPMAPNTAIAFILLGSILFMVDKVDTSAPQFRFALRLNLLLVFIIAVQTLLEHAGFTGRFVDSLFMDIPNEQVDSFPIGKMAIITALLFSGISIALFLLINLRRHEVFSNISYTISIMVFSIGMMFTVSYVIGAPIFYGTATIPPAINTSIGFALLGLGITSLILHREAQQNEDRQFSTDKRILTGFSIALSSVLIISLLSYQNTLHSVDAGNDLFRSHRISILLETLLSNEKDAETAARGFVIARRDRFLEPYRNAVGSRPAVLSVLHSEFQNDPYAENELRILEGMLYRHTDIIAAVITQIIQNKNPDDHLIRMIENGKESMDSLRIAVSNLEMREKEFVVQQTLALSQAVSSTISTDITMIVGVLMVFSFIFVAIQKDLTGRKAAEEKLRVMNDQLEQRVKERTDLLRKSEEQYRNTLDHLMEGCQIIGFDFRYIYVNPVAANQGHHIPESLVGRTMMEVYPGIDQTELFIQLRECMVKRQHKTMENEFAYPDGSKAWFNLSLEPVPEGVFILSVDISEQKKLNEKVTVYQNNLEDLIKVRTRQIDAMQQQFKSLFESVPGLYLVLKPDMTIAGASDAYLQATMTVREQIVGRNLFEVFPDNPGDPSADGVRNLRASLDRVLTTRISDTMAIQKYDIRKPESKGGGFEVRYWSPVNSPVFSTPEKLEFIIHRVEDVTDYVLKKHEETIAGSNPEMQSRVELMEIEIFQRSKELQKLNQKLHAANSELEAFSYSVSHDLRAPLRHINGFIELLEKNASSTLNEKGIRYIHIISDSAKKMGQLIDDLLVFSRMGRTEMLTSRIDMNDVFNEVIKTHEPDTKNRSIEWRVMLLPIVQADLAMMRVVAVNLVSNAIKYTQKKEHAVIDISCSTVDHKYVFSVRDN